MLALASSPTSKPRFLFSKGRTGCPVPPHLNLAWLGSRPPTPQSNRTLKKEKEKREETRRQRGPCDYGATMLCSRCMGKTGRVLDLRKSSNITTNDGQRIIRLKEKEKGRKTCRDGREYLKSGGKWGCAYVVAVQGPVSIKRKKVNFLKHFTFDISQATQL